MRDTRCEKHDTRNTMQKTFPAGNTMQEIQCKIWETQYKMWKTQCKMWEIQCKKHVIRNTMQKTWYDGKKLQSIFLASCMVKGYDIKYAGSKARLLSIKSTFESVTWVQNIQPEIEYRTCGCSIGYYQRVCLEELYSSGFFFFFQYWWQSCQTVLASTPYLDDVKLVDRITKRMIFYQLHLLK